MVTIRNRTTGETRQVDESELGQYGIGGTTSPVMGGLGGGMNNLLPLYLSGALGQPGSLDTTRLLNQLDLIGVLEPEIPASETRSLQNLDRKLALAEKMWFANEDKLALPEEGNFIDRLSHKLRTQYEAPSEYVNYKKYIKTLGATLAKAAGDTGNLALAEQAAQLQALADADLTREEAELAFRNVRIGLGLGDMGDEYYNQLRNSSSPSEKQINTEINNLLETGIVPPVSGGGTTGLPSSLDATIEDIGGDGGNTDIEGPNNRLLELLGSGYTPAAGAIGGGLLFGPFGAAGGTIVGRQTQQAARDIQEGEPLLDALTRNPLNPEEFGQSWNDLKSGALAGLSQLLFTRGPQALTGSIKGRAAKNISVPGKEIVSRAENLAKGSATSQTTKKIPQFAKDLSKSYKGTQSGPSLLTKRSAAGNLGRLKSSGDVKSTISGRFSEYERQAISDALKQRSNLIDLLDRLDTIFYGTQRGARNLTRYAVPSAIGLGLGSLGGYLGSTALNQ